jgi:predicted O-methyltransferase YrrM
LETYDLNILKLVENKIKNYVQLIPEEEKFLNGLIRAIKPKKVVEIGISKGGSSALILNAIKDIKGAKLFSIDRSTYCYRERNKKSGFLVQEKFSELMDKWTLYIGGLTSEFIETIGDGIDLVFIDTKHVTPGEMLDWLMVLPFLKNKSIVVFHDTFFSYYNRKVSRIKRHTSNNNLLCYIRGELILPHYGDSVFFRNIGALKLDPNQQKYYYHYFLALGIQWEYMPNENDLKIMRDFFMKYYGEKYVEVYDDAVKKNKIYLNKY